MTKHEYLTALKDLALTPHGKATAFYLGLKLRQCQRYAAGDAPIPEPIAKLIAEYLKNGLPARVV